MAKSTTQRGYNVYRSFPITTLLILFQLTPLVHGFAAWLNCYVELDDPEEVIMNNLITPAKDSQHGDVTIEVKQAHWDHWANTLTYNENDVIMARLKVPYGISHADIQYVMELVTPLPSDTGGSGAIFTRPKPLMCDGKRASATHYSETVAFTTTGGTDTIQLVAAYALGHAAVTLTNVLTLTKEEEKEL